MRTVKNRARSRVGQAWTTPRDRYSTLRVLIFLFALTGAVVGAGLGLWRGDPVVAGVIGALVGIAVVLVLTPIWYLDSKRHYRRRGDGRGDA
jgi:uncharacterized membrane protein YccC